MDNLLQMLQYTSFFKFCEVSKLKKYQDIYCKMDPWKIPSGTVCQWKPKLWDKN